MPGHPQYQQGKDTLQKNLEAGKTSGIAVLTICAGIFLLGVLRNEPVMECSWLLSSGSRRNP